MAGQCIEKLPHSCGSSDGLQTYFDNGKYTGYCHACWTYIPDPYGGNEPEIVVKSQEEIEQEVADARKCGFVNFTHRAIPPADWKYFGVRLGMSERDGVTPDTVMHPYTRDGKVCGFKVKLLNKKIMWSIGDTKNCDLYGWLGAKKVGGLTLYITEGEEDAIALRNILIQMNRGTAYMLNKVWPWCPYRTELIVLLRIFPDIWMRLIRRGKMLFLRLIMTVLERKQQKLLRLNYYQNAKLHPYQRKMLTLAFVMV